MRLDQPQSFPAVARRIGWTDEWAGQRLRRLCLCREDELALRFVIRDRKGNAARVTLGAVTRYLPELRPARVDSLSDSLRAVAEGLERRQRSLAADEIQKRCAPLLVRLAELESRFATLGQPDTVKTRRRKRPRKRRRGRAP